MKVRWTRHSTSHLQLTLSLDAHDHWRRSRNHHNHHRSQYCEGNTALGSTWVPTYAAYPYYHWPIGCCIYPPYR